MKRLLTALSLLGLAWAASPIELTPESDLQAVIAGAEPGAVLVLAPGVYSLSKGILIDRSLTLSGAGSDKTEIISSAPEYLIKVIGSDTDWVTEGLTFSHTGDDWADVVLLQDAKGKFRDIAFSGAHSNRAEQQADAEAPNRGGRGLVLSGRASGQLESVLASDNDLFGMAVEDEAHLDLNRSTLRGNGSVGIVFAGSSGGTMSHTLVENHPSHGVVVSGDADPLLEGNTLRANARLGILYEGNASGTARANLSEGNSIGISVAGKATPLLEGNTLHDNGLTGIFYSGAAAGIARGNTSDSNRSRGISVAGSATPLLEDNLLTGNLDLAIIFSEDSKAKVSGNRCEKGGNYDFFVVAPSEPELLENACEVMVAPLPE